MRATKPCLAIAVILAWSACETQAAGSNIARISPTTVNEGSGGGITPAEFKVSLIVPAAQRVTIDYQTVGGTATAGVDFVEAQGTVTFEPGELAKTITVDVIADDVVEPNEYFSVGLSNARNAAIPRPSGTGVIAADDDAPTPSSIFWRDRIQEGDSLGGFHAFGVQYNGLHVVPNDANGANLCLAPDPAGGPGYALRHYASFDSPGGARSQACLFSFAMPELALQAMSDEGVYVAMEWYFPEVLKADYSGPWINLWDWHSTGDWGSNRWHTAPGMFLRRNGKMLFELVHFFGGGYSGLSKVPFPVGRWFDIEMHFKWTDKPTTIRVWIDGELAIEHLVPRTKDPKHTVLELYSKFYGLGGWNPSPSVRYTRNVRISGSRIWPGS